MKVNKKVICLGLALSMAVSFGMPAGSGGSAVAEAKKTTKKITIKASKVKLNKKKVTITLDENAAKTVTLKVKKASKKVTWKTSDKKIAVVKKTNGKKKQNAVIQGKKEGTCTITAKVGKKKLKCQVTVKKGAPVEGPAESTQPVQPVEPAKVITQGAIGMYVTSATATGNSVTVTVNFYNGTDSETWWGRPYWINKWENEKWVRLKWYNSYYDVEEDDVAFAMDIQYIEPNTEVTKTYTMETKQNFTSGKYYIATQLGTVNKEAFVNNVDYFWLNME